MSGQEVFFDAFTKAKCVLVPWLVVSKLMFDSFQVVTPNTLYNKRMLAISQKPASCVAPIF